MGMERYRPKTKGVDGVSDAIATKIKNDAYDKEYAAMMKEYNKRVKAQNFEDKSMLGRGNKTISDADRAKLAKMMGMNMGGKVKKMKVGGEAVPSKFKGFSKLPEGVQQKIDPKLASKYEMGGKVEEYGGGGKVKGGKMSCRGMGKALRGGGFKIS